MFGFTFYQKQKHCVPYSRREFEKLLVVTNSTFFNTN